MAHAIDLSTNNPLLAPLIGKVYDKKFTALPNKNLPKAVFSAVGRFYKEITGTDLSVDTCTIAVKADRGTFQRVYKPTLYKLDETAFGLKWGDELIKLDISGKKFQAPNVECGVTFKFVDIPVGNSRDLVLRAALYDDATSEFFTLDFGVYVVDFKNQPLADELEALVSRAPKKATVAFKLYEEYKGFEGELFGCNQLAVGTYEITGYRPVHIASQGRTTYILRAQPNEELDQPKEFEVWADNSFGAIFSGDPVVTPEKPGKLMIHDVLPPKKAGGNPKAICGFQLGEQPMKDAGLDLDF